MGIQLPEDIIVVEILSRLPVKYLLRFRCVCKSWCSLISSTDFAKLQLKLRSQIGIRKIILRLRDHEFRSVDYLSPSKLLQFPFSIHEAAFIVGSSNGLVCTSLCTSVGFREFFLWNPTTNDYTKIPDSKFNEYTEFGFGYGFGYDSSDDDYKIIVVNGPVHIFSLKRGTWKCLPDTQCHGCYFTFKRGVFVNGSLHWLCLEGTADRGDVGRSVIVSFGLAEERFSYFYLPDNVRVQLSSIYTRRIGVLDGYLCLNTLSEGPVGRSQIVWIMKEYGVSSSWTTHFDLPKVRSRQGDILSTNRDVIVYVESLVSPNAIKTEHKRKMLLP